MPLCQECDSQVAEQDIFCPYCGISMNPIAVGTSASEDPFASTIVIPSIEQRGVPTEGETSHADEPVDDVSQVADAPEISADVEKSDETEIRVGEEAAADSVSEDNPDDPSTVITAKNEAVGEVEFEQDSFDQTPPIPEPATLEQIREIAGFANVKVDRSEFDTEIKEQPSDLSAKPEIPVVETDSTAPVVDSPSGTSPNIKAGDTDGRKSGLKPLAEGTVLNNRYEIVKKIGGGGMGAVYLANDRNLGGVTRAVKEMVQAHIEEAQQEKAIDDFRRESMILSTLDHGSIPTIYDYFYDSAECRFYLVMKYISGGDLAGRLRSTPEGRIDEKTVTEWSLQITEVLSYLHNLPQTIVYRDLKPSNVMIDGNTGRIMLIDFGIARSINQNQEKGVTAVGTMGYAPPELFSGNVEPRSDLYSLGSTMFHLLTGADPQNNPLLIFDFQKNPRPRQINPRLSDQMERILMHSVEYIAESRFESADEMHDALAAHLKNLAAGNITYGVSEAPAAVSLTNQSVFCGFCGQRIVAADMFCAFCGAKQPMAQHGVIHSTFADSGSAATARLVIDGTSDLDVPAYSLDKEMSLLGRRDPMSNIFPEVDLSKFDPQTKISRRHARIWRDGPNFLIEDLGSSNGTILLTSESGELKLSPHKPYPLMNGNRVRVGDTTLHFLVG